MPQDGPQGDKKPKKANPFSLFLIFVLLVFSGDKSISESNPFQMFLILVLLVQSYEMLKIKFGNI
ncbi:hypothetical protein [Calderihabitans maritimus]|uniref:Uncharacterized protein n=1 Tax=Calderihabitans maritimus TaxID=1246530 RepID=A0A1Z5HNL8_9FIRM|nr:hypothetical protein [Calderihabitans maritimus]GAW90860.1 hypothetical protein KKC1_00220 [Calderihabitans maritimus]